MFEENIPPKNLPEISSFLANLSLFQHLKISALNELAASMTLVHINGAETVIRKGDKDYTLFILYSGRLGVFQNDNRIADISPGQVIGEFSLLTHEPRTSTVCALRDSILLKLTQDHFKKFELNYPNEVLSMAKTAIQRLLIKPPIVRPGEKSAIITVAPSGDSNHLIFSEHLVRELNKIKPTILINSDICNKHFNKNVSQISAGNSEDQAILSWFQSLESKSGFIVFETDRQMTPWTERCIRQADRVIFVADSKVNPANNSIEIQYFDKDYKNLALSELVIIHPDDCTKITGTKQWLATRDIDNFNHLRMSSPSDWGRFIRNITGRSLGIALSGGGARGLAHLGALKALEELNVPIDFIFGSSSGAIVAGGYALFGMEKALENCMDFSKSPIKDYTFPFVSLFKGKRICDALTQYYGESNIEDLWIKFACVSTNLTKNCLELHDRGYIWKAIRSSVSLPGIFPPFFTDTGDMLVDGGITNNLPVDIMRKYMTGGKILAISCLSKKKNKLELSIDNLHYKGWTSGWKPLFNSFNPFSKCKPSNENIFEIILHSITLSSESHQRSIEKEADYLLKLDASEFSFLEFKSAKKLIEKGYSQAMEKLPLLLEMEKFSHPEI